MKTKYIKLNDNIRCRLKLTGYRKQIELQLEKKVLWFIYRKVGRWMHVDEGFWGECPDKNSPFYRNPMILEYVGGNISEIYISDTLNIEKRILDFYKEYKRAEFKKERILKSFNSI